MIRSLKFLRLTLALMSLGGLNSVAAKADASTLYVGSFNNDSVLRFDGQTGQFIDNFVSNGEGGLDGPVALTFDPEERNLHVISLFTDSILRYGRGTGTLTDEFISQESGDLDLPQDLTFGPDNNLYVSNPGKDTINLYDGQTGNFKKALFSGNKASCNAPFGVKFGPDDNLYFSCTFSNSIRRYDTQTGKTEPLVTINVPGAAPGGLAFGPDDNLYIANFGANTIDRYNFGTGKLEAFIERVDSPVQPVFGPDGNLYVSSNPTQKLGQPIPGKVLRYNGQTGTLLDEFIPEKRGGLDGAGWLAFTPETVPEPSSVLGILTFGALGAGSLLKRKPHNQQKTR